MNPELTAPASPAQSQASRRPAWLSFDNRYLPPVFITFILLVGQLVGGILESYEKTLLAIVSAIAAEILLGRVFTGKWPHLASAYITGISVGILVRSPAAWPYMWVSVLSIASKYVLRVKGRHIWNPSNFGISAMLFLAPFIGATLSVQWGNNLTAMLVIWGLGSIIIYRLKRFHISATYVASFFLFALLRSWITGHTFQAEIAPITGPMYQLFVFFMITDPKTTVRSKVGQCAVAFSVALVEFTLRLFESVHAPYYALFLVGPMANLIEIWLTPRKEREPAVKGSAPPAAAGG
ncbi:MAG TPA: RnfABCDGE type electron transport complex subunit D [Pyrinomonadaceae bacterium]|nr:RnfABCDGE type electron transport complex subunit D [Pyrinomonadaceae bacterium]